MVDTVTQVEEKLKKTLANDDELTDVLLLWELVREWNAQGGKPAIEAGLKEHAKEIGKNASEELAQLKKILKDGD